MGFCEECQKAHEHSIFGWIEHDWDFILVMMAIWIAFGALMIARDIVTYDVALSALGNQTALGQDHIFDFMCNGITLGDLVHFAAILPAWVFFKILFTVLNFGSAIVVAVGKPIYDAVFNTTLTTAKCPFFCS